MRGAGKSTLCKKIQEFYPVLFIFDTLGEYDQDQDAIFVNDYESFSNVVIETSEKEVVKVVIQFHIDDAGDPDYIDEFIKLLYYRENCTIVLEEVQNFASVYKIPHYMKQVSLTGRHRGINFITTTQRIAEIHKSLLSQSHHIFSGFTDSPNDKKTLREYGFNLSDIETIQQYQFLWKEGRDISKIFNDLSYQAKPSPEAQTDEIEEIEQEEIESEEIQE